MSQAEIAAAQRDAEQARTLGAVLTVRCPHKAAAARALLNALAHHVDALVAALREAAPCRG